MLSRIEFFAVNGTVYKNLSAYIKQTYKFFIFCAICKYYTNNNISLMALMEKIILQASV